MSQYLRAAHRQAKRKTNMVRAMRVRVKPGSRNDKE
jgi:hypothetical protein